MRFKTGFYSTYEELKPPPLKEAIDKAMPFLQYLWGIETKGVDLVGRIWNSFLQYLWGIETLNVLTFKAYLW